MKSTRYLIIKRLYVAVYLIEFDLDFDPLELIKKEDSSCKFKWKSSAKATSIKYCLIVDFFVHY